MITIVSIQRGVAKAYRVPFKVMREPDGIGSRIPRHVRPRQVAMTLAARLTDHSLNRIGHFFGGRDHTTVMHAIRIVEKRRGKGGQAGKKIHNTMRRVTLGLIPSTFPQAKNLLQPSRKSKS